MKFKQILKHSHNQYFTTSYSLEGEDCLLYRYFSDKKNGFYIDIGAHHPFRFNNTYLFYLNGWNGINIDADRNAICLFNRYRKRDINIVSALGDSSENQVYYQFNDSALSTFNKSYCRKYVSDGYKLVKKTKIRLEKLSDVLLKHLDNKSVIDFLSLDVEGLELDVLKSNNWELYTPKLLLVEAFIPSIKNASELNITKFLKTKNYTLICKTLSNLIYEKNNL